jgi:autotransporter translocation and assembly factor TamB
MKKLALLLGAALLGSLPAAADEVVRTLDRQVSVADASGIHLDFPVGEVQVDAGEGRQVRVQLKLECDSARQTRCVEAAKAIDLVSSTSAGRVHIGLKGWPKSGTRGLEATFVVSVPRDLPLKAELGVGEMAISGLENDLNADLGVGEIRIKMAESAVASVNVDTGIGEANLYAQGHHWESSGLISRELKWHEGRGKALINVDCGVGEAQVRLD